MRAVGRKRSSGTSDAPGSAAAAAAEAAQSHPFPIGIRFRRKIIDAATQTIVGVK